MPDRLARSARLEPASSEAPPAALAHPRALKLAEARDPVVEALPDDAPLEMPVQSLWTRVRPHVRRLPGETDLWRAVIFAMTGLMTLVALRAGYSVLEVGGLGPLDLISLALFALLFGWIALSLATAIVGFCLSLTHGDDAPELNPAQPLPTLTRRTAILAPIHNEDPAPVFARLGAMLGSLEALGVGAAFDLFVLSDTRDGDILAHEAEAVLALRRRTLGGSGVYYRHRAVNEGRKAGNIADWVRRFGGAYDHMAVLDADSLMDGETLVRLAGAMERSPRLGLIQTAPLLVNRESLFGRLQQFATRLYGPMLSEGLAALSGPDGNYWGHNALIRVCAFAEQAGLPRLRGPKPFGGDILSHDFVEAALLRRGGWEVRMAPRLTGSYEECPPTLADLLVRERRWCQGNLQHIQVIAARGLTPMSRLHLVRGFSAYLTSPLWLLFLIVGALQPMQSGALASGQWDAFNLRLLEWVFSISMASLLLPKLLAMGLVLSRPGEWRSWGGAGRLVGGFVVELLLSTLIAPILMIAQTKALIDILMGRDAGWSAQRREDGAVTWPDAARRHALHTAAGLALGVFAYLLSPVTLLWMIPVISGLLLAIPLSVVTADPAFGGWVRRLGLLATPEEREPPAIFAQALAG